MREWGRGVRVRVMLAAPLNILIVTITQARFCHYNNIMFMCGYYSIIYVGYIHTMILINILLNY